MHIEGSTRLAGFVGVLGVLAGCQVTVATTDPDSGRGDAGENDTGVASVDVQASDADATARDAGSSDTGRDAPSTDVPLADTSLTDVGVAEGSTVDVLAVDAVSADAPTVDAHAADTILADAGAPDVIAVDAGPADSGPRDTGAADTGVTDTGPRDAGVVDTGPLGDAGALATTLDALTAAHVRDLLARGAARGNLRDVVAKIGDSITESASFLMDCGHGWYSVGARGDVESTIAYFSTRTLPGGENSLARSSLCATAGWTALDALAGGDPASPLARELDAIHPQWAVVMYGTNDLDHEDAAAFTVDLGHVVDLIESRVAVPILSTIPPRLDGATPGAQVAPYNAAIRALALARHLPLVDYWGALQAAPGDGLSPDGIHPDVLNGSDGCIFTTEGLMYGYNLRNLVTLTMLEELRAY